MFVSLTMKRLSTESNIRRLLNVYGKPRHRCGKDISLIKNLYWNKKEHMRT